MSSLLFSFFCFFSSLMTWSPKVILKIRISTILVCYTTGYSTLNRRLQDHIVCPLCKRRFESWRHVWRIELGIWLDQKEMLLGSQLTAFFARPSATKLASRQRCCIWWWGIVERIWWISLCQLQTFHQGLRNKMERMIKREWPTTIIKS